MSRFAFGMIIALAAMWVSVPASAATSPWKVVATPSPSTQANYLTSVITLNSNDAWAVGAWYRPTTSTPGTLTIRWDGTTWSRIPSPNRNEG